MVRGKFIMIAIEEERGFRLRSKIYGMARPLAVYVKLTVLAFLLMYVFGQENNIAFANAMMIYICMKEFR